MREGAVKVKPLKKSKARFNDAVKAVNQKVLRTLLLVVHP